MLNSCFKHCCCYLFAPPKEEPYQLQLLSHTEEQEEDQINITELKTRIMNSIPADCNQKHHSIRINEIVEVFYLIDPINGYSILIQYIGSKTGVVYQGRSTDSYEEACEHLFSDNNSQSILTDASVIITPY